MLLTMAVIATMAKIWIAQSNEKATFRLPLRKAMDGLLSGDQQLT
jgi:hypothetical protein